MIDLSAWEDPAWSCDYAQRRSDFVDKLTFLLEYITPGIPT